MIWQIELQNLAQKHVEDGSRSSHNVERESTLASTVAMLESRHSALDQCMDAVEPCYCRCKGDDILSTEEILGNLSGTLKRRMKPQILLY